MLKRLSTGKFLIYLLVLALVALQFPVTPKALAAAQVYEAESAVLSGERRQRLTIPGTPGRDSPAGSRTATKEMLLRSLM